MRGSRYTYEEIILCTYAARFDERELGGYKAIGQLRGRTNASVRAKILNIAAMLQEKGISRERDLATLSGTPEGKGPRMTDWEIVEPLTKLSKEELCGRCRVVLGGEKSRPQGSQQPAARRYLPDEADKVVAEEPFDPSNMAEGRQKTLAAIVRRRGQDAFRAALLVAYEERCTVTESGVVPTLQAAHIVPYRGEDTNNVTNGLLLRSDVHDLFDLGLLGVDPEEMTVLLAPALAGSEYAQLAGRPIRLPRAERLRPSRKALRWHRRESRL